MSKRKPGVRRITDNGHYVEYEMPAHLVDKLLALHAKRETVMPHERAAIDAEIAHVKTVETVNYWKNREEISSKRSGRR